MVTSSEATYGGRDIPYLKPKAEPFAYSGPNSLWETVVPMSFINSRLTANGINIGAVSSITPLNGMNREGSSELRSKAPEVQGNFGDYTSGRLLVPAK